MYKKRLPLIEAVLLVVLIVAPLFLNDFLTVIATRMLILALLAISFDLCWGYSGIMTFGQGLFFDHVFIHYKSTSAKYDAHFGFYG